MKRLLLLILIGSNAYGQWYVTHNEHDSHARSPSTESMKPMTDPYMLTRSWITVGCNTLGDTWAFFEFTNTPNMLNADEKEGYNTTRHLIRWDSKLDVITLNQKWKSSQLKAVYTDYVVSNIKKYTRMTLDMTDWSGTNKPYFTYDLKGSSKAINEIFDKCSNKK